MKVATWNGCRDCPYARKFDEDINDTYWCLHQSDLDIGSIKPETPHPCCKLKDLPTEDEINKQFPLVEGMGIKQIAETLNKHEGANFILKKLK